MIARRESTIGEEGVVGLKFFYRQGATPTSPLAVFVHGRAGNRGVMWTFDRVIPQDYHIVSFEAFLPDPIGGWSWWHVSGAPSESKKEEIVYAAHKLRHAVESLQGLLGIAPEKMIALGFSQGGILVSAATFLELLPFAAIGVLASSLFLPNDLPEFRCRPRVFVAHGTLDETIPVERARVGSQALEARGLAVRYVEEDVGHKVGIQGVRALKQWIESLQ
jgi:phospholipase/carboxylesterase